MDYTNAVEAISNINFDHVHRSKVTVSMVNLVLVQIASNSGDPTKLFYINGFLKRQNQQILVVFSYALGQLPLGTGTGLEEAMLVHRE
jgi:hypothetical protein